MALIEFTDSGLYCRAGGFYIDPWKPVKRSIITHAHSDHARSGNGYYLCHHLTKPILRLRLGDINCESIGWNETVTMNGVKVSLHPAGHVIGSSQIRLESGGEVWVVSGDYKIENDGWSGAFEPVRCHTFITECTFGLPVYRWKSQREIFDDMRDWILKNHERGLTSVLIAYSLGKAQRILTPLVETGLPIFLHGAVHNVHETLSASGVPLPAVTRVVPETLKSETAGNIVIAPSGADRTTWVRRFFPYNVGVCSGWMQVRGNVRRRNVGAGFVLSDHADWNGLLQAVSTTGAERVYATHGFQSVFARYLNEIGIQAAEVKTEFGNDEEEGPTIENVNEQ